MPIVPNVIQRHPCLVARGLYIECHDNDAMEFPERELQQHNVFLYTGASVRAEISHGRTSGVHWMHPGSLWVMPHGSSHKVRFEGPTAGIALAFDPARFTALVESAGGKRPSQIVESLAASPPRIAHLMHALACESNLPSSQDRFGLECIATAIALALTQQAGPAEVSRPSSGLAPRQLRAVQAFIAEHLTGTLTLAELAAVAGLSPFHFLRSFKCTTGSTPRQYVLSLRMERARSLLGLPHLSIGEIAVSVGFDHPSHFARAFREAVGVPPSTFRQHCQR